MSTPQTDGKPEGSTRLTPVSGSASCVWHKGEKPIKDDDTPGCCGCGAMYATRDCENCGQTFLDWKARGYDDVIAGPYVTTSGDKTKLSDRHTDMDLDPKTHPGSLERLVRPCDVAALFCRSDSVYKTIAGVDVWDKERDARNWPGGRPVIAHPPCRAWGQLRAFSKAPPGEKELAILAVRFVRDNGGVLEHPARSTLWPVAGLPEPGERDAWGGWTMAAPQFWWGHRADKATRLYIVGCQPKELPSVPMKLGEATHVISSVNKSGNRRGRWKPQVYKWEREATPEAFAKWLVQVASLCRPNIVLDHQPTDPKDRK